MGFRKFLILATMVAAVAFPAFADPLTVVFKVPKGTPSDLKVVLSTEKVFGTDMKPVVVMFGGDAATTKFFTGVIKVPKSAKFVCVNVVAPGWFFHSASDGTTSSDGRTCMPVDRLVTSNGAWTTDASGGETTLIHP